MSPNSNVPFASARSAVPGALAATPNHLGEFGGRIRPVPRSSTGCRFVWRERWRP